MTILGKGMWDSPTEVLGSLIPKYAGFDLGSTAHKFRNLYLEGAIVATGETFANGDWITWLSSGGVVSNIIRMSTADNTVLNAITGKAIHLKINDVVAWGVDASLNLYQDTTNGGNLIMGKAGSQIFVGQSAAFNGLGGANITSANTTGANSVLSTFSTTAATGPNLYFGRSHNATIGTNTIVVSGDTLGRIVAFGANGTSYDAAAAILFRSDGTPGAANDMPGSITFQTCLDGTATLSSRFTIDNVGVMYDEVYSSAMNSDKFTLCETSSSTRYGMGLCYGAASNVGNAINFYKTRAVSNSPATIIQNSDIFGNINFYGSNGVASYLQGAAIVASVDSAPGAASMPGRLNFLTTPSGSSTALTRWSVSSAGILSNDGTNGGDLQFNKAASKVIYKTGGAAATSGTFVANGATAVVVSTTSAAVGNTYTFGLNTVGGTPAGAPYLSAVSAGVSFSVKCAAGDTSTYNWAIVATA